MTRHTRKNQADMSTSPKPAKLLIVDDVPENIQVLFDFLNEQAFEILVAEDGENGLDIAREELPDLILLDIMMPGLNGFEVCAALKANSRTRSIPVIFMTALSETINKVAGFKLGAVDYVTKPLQHEEVLARIKAHLTIHQLQQALALSNQTLQDSNVALAQANASLALKNRELTEKNAELDAFAHTVAHDLKNPLGVIIGMQRLLAKSLSQQLDQKNFSYFQMIGEAGQQMHSIIEALLLLAYVGRTEVECTALDMGLLIVQVERRLAPMLARHQAVIQHPPQWPVAIGYAPWVLEIWMNYLSNALKYGGRPPQVTLGAERREDAVYFWVDDNGPGLPDEARAKLFTPFTRLAHTHQEEGHGLGLSIVERIAHRLHGQAGVENLPGQGCRFYFSLPCETSA